MKKDSCFSSGGLKLVQVSGPFMELYFDWSQLPPVDLRKEIYIVQIVPDSALLPVEFARPNSAGPLLFHLKESVSYRLNLLAVPHFDYQVSSNLKEAPLVELIPQHENSQKLIWGNIDYASAGEISESGFLEILVDDRIYQQIGLNEQPYCEIRGRPGKIEVRLEKGKTLFTVTTNLNRSEIKHYLDFTVEKSSTKLGVSTIVKSSSDWWIRAEMNPSYRMRILWRSFFLKRFPDCDPEHIIGQYNFYENNNLVNEIRQFGFATRIRHSLIDYIQLEEWKQTQRKQVRKYKLQLQITSAHRELYRFVLAEKQYPAESPNNTIGFSETEIEAAEKKLFDVNPHVSWEQAYLELVLWFKVDAYEWQEFQRDNAHSLKWEYQPALTTDSCKCEWILFNLKNPDQRLVTLKSQAIKRINWPGVVVLKPYNANRLLAWWDLARNDVENAIKATWNVNFSDVGFYLKINEEHLGNRVHREDLDCHIIEIFSPHQNIYFDVEPGKCFSAEIVARHYHKEIALTPVSHSIVTPRDIKGVNTVGTACRSLSKAGIILPNVKSGIVLVKIVTIKRKFFYICIFILQTCFELNLFENII